VGHLTLLFCTFRYTLSYITFNATSRWAVFSYRLAFVSAAATYGIVVYKGIRARSRPSGQTGQRPSQSPLSYLLDENVQYLLMALVWLYSRQIPLALLPFSVYSVFHVATYTRANLIPTIQPSPAAGAKSPGKSPGAGEKYSSPLADTIGRFVKQYYDASMSLVAALEIALWFRVLLSAFTFSKGGFLLVIIYTAFFRSRYSQSTFVQGAFHNFAQRIDTQVANQSTPPAARQAWHTVKGVVQQVADVTDIRKYTGGGQAAAAKKPQ
jgi:transmembrane protein 33